MTVRPPFRHGVAWTTCVLAIVLMAIYAAAPTRNHYWDGIGFALNIEGVPQDEAGHQPHDEGPGEVYYNPNHLLYNACGRAAFSLVRIVLPAVRALDVLVWWSILSSVAAAGMLFVLLLRQTHNRALSVWLTLLFALSATWWKFSTDANAYVPGTAVLVLCALWAQSKKRQPLWRIGLGHAVAMLLHQIAICFYPAVLVAIWRHGSYTDRRARLRAMAVYSLTAGISVAAAYVTVWLGVLNRPADPRAFLSWVLFNGSDVLTRKTLLGRAADMLVANLRVFFGGKASLALQFLEWPWLVAAVSLVLACSGLIIRALWRNRGHWPSLKGSITGDHAFALAWLGGFLVFLSVWLTEYQYYRLFCLPAFILWLGVCWRHVDLRGRQLSHPLPAFVVLMATLNFTLYIGPYSRAEASPPLHVALEARSVLADDAVVYFSDFNCDNWWIKYFNMRTTWRQAPLDQHDDFSAELESLLRSGRRVYFDTGLHQQLNANPRAKERLTETFMFDHALGYSSRKHHIQFVEVKPRQI